MTETTTRVRLASPVRCYLCGAWLKEGTNVYAVLRPTGYVHKHLPVCKAVK